MRSAWIVLNLVATILLPFAATEITSATHECTCAEPGCTGVIEITGGTEDTTFYRDNRNRLDVLPWNGIWVYEETNGIWSGRAPGVYGGAGPIAEDLQRGGGSIVVPGMVDVCVDDPLVIPDALILGA